MESAPDNLDKEKEVVKMVSDRVRTTLKNIYGLELNNFENMRLWAYTKEAIEREENDKKSSNAEQEAKGQLPIPRAFNSNSINPELEALEFFLTRELGVSTQDVHRVYELDLPGGAKWEFKSEPEVKYTHSILEEKGFKVGMSKTSKVVKDFKKYLKILQKRNREGVISEE